MAAKSGRACTLISQSTRAVIIYEVVLFCLDNVWICVCSVLTETVCGLSCRGSLERLGLEQLALGQLHWSTANYAPPQERALWDGLVAMYDQVRSLFPHPRKPHNFRLASRRGFGGWTSAPHDRGWRFGDPHQRIESSMGDIVSYDLVHHVLFRVPWNQTESLNRENAWLGI